MAESGGLFILDGEDAGSAPWEFTVIYKDATNVFALDAAAKNNGSYGYSATFDGTDDICNGTLTFTERTEIYVRAYVYIHSNFSFSAPAECISLRLGDGSVTLCEVRIRRTTAGAGNPEAWRIIGQDLTTTGTGTNFSIGAWHYIEIHWLAGTGADGGAQVWIDGDSVFSEFDNNLTAYAVDRIQVGNTASGANPVADSVLYFDDIKGDTSYIGAYPEEDVTRSGITIRLLQ